MPPLVVNNRLPSWSCPHTAPLNTSVLGLGINIILYHSLSTADPETPSRVFCEEFGEHFANYFYFCRSVGWRIEWNIQIDWTELNQEKVIGEISLFLHLCMAVLIGLVDWHWLEGLASPRIRLTGIGLCGIASPRIRLTGIGLWGIASPRSILTDIGLWGTASLRIRLTTIGLWGIASPRIRLTGIGLWGIASPRSMLTDIGLWGTASPRIRLIGIGLWGIASPRCRLTGIGLPLPVACWLALGYEALPLPVFFFISNIFIQGKTFSHWLFSHVALCTHITSTTIKYTKYIKSIFRSKSPKMRNIIASVYEQCMTIHIKYKW